MDGCRGAGGGVVRSPLVKSVKKQIQLIGSFSITSYCLAARWFVASDAPNAAPHILQVVLLKFVLQLPPIAVFALLDPLLKLPLNTPHLFPVPISEGSLLLIQQDLDVSGDPRLVIWETAYSHCRNNTVHTEVDVPCYAVLEIIKVLSITEQHPVC